MRNSTRAALALGLGLVGVAGLVAPSMGQQGQDGGVRQAASTAAGAAQPTAPKPAPAAVIGVIDLNLVARNYDKLRVAQEAIQADAMARSNDLMKLQQEGAAEVEKLKKLAPGSLDQKKIEERLSELKAKIQAVKEQAQMEFERREAEISATTYNEIQKMAEGVAKQRGMNLVVQFSATPPSGNDPNALQMAMMRSVVVADQKLDLTADVTKWLNHYYRQSGGPAPKGTAANPAAGAATPAPAAAAGAGAGATRR